MRNTKHVKTPVVKAVLVLSSGDDYFVVGPTYTGYNIDAGKGNDTVVVSHGNDKVKGGAGNDYIYNPGGNDTLLGGEGNDTVIDAGHGSSVLSGDAGEDYLVDWMSGNDTLLGGEGNDSLTGTGRDMMSGDAGRDVFKIVFSGAPIEITIDDFEPGEKLNLGALGWWDEWGYHPLTANDLEIDGDNLIAHTVFGDAIIIGVGDEVALVGIANAVIFDDGSYGGKG